MINRKARPTDGPGANHLRGGQKEFCNKTAVGGWIENVGGTGEYQRGFTTPNFITESQHQQNGNRKMVMYGLALPKQHQVENPHTTRDLFHPRSGPKSSDWESTTRNMQNSLFNKSEGKHEDSNIDTYRKEWTTETNEGRIMRFNTESRRAGNLSVGEDFQVKTIRSLPGSLAVYERIIQQLRDKYGIFALSAIRSELKCESMTLSDLKLVWGKLGVVLSRNEHTQLHSDLTHSNNFLTSKLIGALTPSLPVLDAESVETLFSNIFGESSSVSVAEVEMRISSNNQHIEVAEGIRVFICGYTRYDYSIGVKEFLLLHSDMLTSFPEKYNSVVADLWKAK